MLGNIDKNIFLKIWPFLIYKLLKGSLFVTTITFFIFFQEKGLNFVKISSLLSLLFIVPIFFEIITGTFADAFGRKKSVLIGYFSEALILYGIIISDNYLILLALFTTWGIMATFSSGADDAWAIESLSDNHEDDIFNSYYSLSSSFYSIGMILAGLLSSILIFIYGQAGVWVARLFITFLILVIFIFTKEKYVRQIAEKSNIKQFFITFLEAFHNFRSNKTIHNIILGEIFATVSLVGIGSVIMQKYLLESSFDEKYWGIAYSIAAIIGVIMPIIAIQVSKKFLYQKNYLVTMLLLHGILFLSASAILNPIFAFLFILLHNLFEEAFNPISSAFFQKEVLPSVRSTMGSLQTTAISLAAAIGSLIAGISVTHLGSRLSMLLMSFPVIISIIFYYKIKTPILLKE